MKISQRTKADDVLKWENQTLPRATRELHRTATDIAVAKSEELHNSQYGLV